MRHRSKNGIQEIQNKKAYKSLFYIIYDLSTNETRKVKHSEGNGTETWLATLQSFSYGTIFLVMTFIDELRNRCGSKFLTLQLVVTIESVNEVMLIISRAN